MTRTAAEPVVAADRVPLRSFLAALHAAAELGVVPVRMTWLSAVKMI